MAFRKRPDELNTADMARFLDAAQKLHSAINMPNLRVGSPQRKALQEMNVRLLEDVKAVTGKEAEWIRWGSTGPGQL